ncbi:MAG: hypothetical protein U0326_35060 [Polyangiales bacterium]
MRRTLVASMGLSLLFAVTAAVDAQPSPRRNVLEANAGRLRAQTQTQPQAQPPHAPLRPSGRTFGGVSEDRILEALRNAHIDGRRAVGSTSVNFYLDLSGDVDAGWKACYTDHCERYRAEIAAFRLNRLLGINRVPPAISRVVNRASLRLARETTIPIIFDRADNARGAAVYWVPVMRDSMIDRNREIERWTRWLHQGDALPADQSTRAEEISTLLVFDFLTGNWDRWSGSNVPMDPAGHLIYRDNNGGFEEPFVDALMHRSLQWLRRAQRFITSVIDHARGLTEATVRAEMALDPDRDHPPLTDAQIRSLLRRRDALLQHVDALVARHGARNVYAW